MAHPHNLTRVATGAPPTPAAKPEPPKLAILKIKPAEKATKPVKEGKSDAS